MGEEGRAPRVLILAGEASGDHHAARVVETVSARRPEVEWVGLGGPELEALGVETWAGLDRLAVMGFVEVIRHLGFFRKLEKRAVAALDSGAIDLVLAVDYPGFNLRIARKAHDRGVPVLFYVAPQVWAWKSHRAKQLADWADRIAVILPFEPPIFEAEGGDVEFVGHPLAERDDAESPSREIRHDLGVASDAPLLALLPGSRAQELDRHLDPFVDAARRLRELHPDLVPVLAVAPGVDGERFRATGLPVTAHTRALLRASRAAIVKSGTSTLEAALAGVPFVMAYRTSFLTWALAKRLVKVDHIALANLVADRRVVPELLQGDVTGQRLADALQPLMVDGEAREVMLQDLEDVRRRLGGPGASGRVAEMALELLEERGR